MSDSVRKIVDNEDDETLGRADFAIDNGNPFIGTWVGEGEAI